MPYRYADEAITKKGRMALPWIGMKKSSRDPRSGKLAGRFSGTPEEIWIERRDGVAPFDARRDSSGRELSLFGGEFLESHCRHSVKC